MVCLPFAGRPFGGYYRLCHSTGFPPPMAKPSFRFSCHCWVPGIALRCCAAWLLRCTVGIGLAVVGDTAKCSTANRLASVGYNANGSPQATGSTLKRKMVNFPTLRWQGSNSVRAVVLIYRAKYHSVGVPTGPKIKCLMGMTIR